MLDLPLSGDIIVHPLTLNRVRGLLKYASVAAPSGPQRTLRPD